MHESPSDLRDLQDILDRSYQTAGRHIQATFTEESRLSATALVLSLPGIFEMHLAVTTPNGSPMVAPIDAALFQGRIWFGLPKHSVRSRLVRRDPRISASYTRGESFGLIVHGEAVEVSTNDALYTRYFNHVQSLYISMYGPKWAVWYEKNRSEIEGGYYGWIEPRRMYAKG
jgi:hypothetical protein